MVQSTLTRTQCRSLLYKALARGFAYPTNDLVEAIASREYWTGLREIFASFENGQRPMSDLTVSIADAICSEAQTKTLAGFEIEYNRLFQLAREAPCPLTASEYMPGESRQALAVAQLRGILNRFGLKVRSGYEADHLAVLLEFMAWMCAKEHRAECTGQADKVQTCARAERIIVEDYLGWAPLLLEALGRGSELLFYRWLAQCLVQFLRMERQALGICDVG